MTVLLKETHLGFVEVFFCNKFTDIFKDGINAGIKMYPLIWTDVKTDVYCLEMLNIIDPDGEERKKLRKYYEEEYARRHTIYLK